LKQEFGKVQIHKKCEFTSLFKTPKPLLAYENFYIVKSIFNEYFELAANSSNLHEFKF